jgi:hypothetical protein
VYRSIIKDLGVVVEFSLIINDIRLKVKVRG